MFRKIFVELLFNISGLFLCLCLHEPQKTKPPFGLPAIAWQTERGFEAQLHRLTAVEGYFFFFVAFFLVVVFLAAFFLAAMTDLL